MIGKNLPEGLEALVDLELAWPSPVDSLHPRRGARVIPMHPTTGVMSDLVRAEGFRNAATLLFESLTSDGRSESLAFPFATCWRHSIELQLKVLLPDLQRITFEPPVDPSTFSHNILKLWRTVKPLLERTFPPDQDTEEVERLLGQLHAIDPDGQEFRYAFTKSGKPTLTSLQTLDAERFHRSLLGVASFLDAAIHGVWHLASYLDA